MDIILETKDLTKTYKAGNNHINAVDHTSICVERGDFVTIVGKSGSGKSTLLHLIGGLDYPTSCEVWIDNECITNMNEEDLSAFRRRKIGFIFQAFNLVTPQKRIRWGSAGRWKPKFITAPSSSLSIRALRVRRRWLISIPRFVPVPTLPSCRA